MLKEVEGSGRGENGDRHTKSFRDKENMEQETEKSDRIRQRKNIIQNMFNSERNLEIFET